MAASPSLFLAIFLVDLALTLEARSVSIKSINILIDGISMPHLLGEDH
jgi:hypothetical protein